MRHVSAIFVATVLSHAVLSAQSPSPGHQAPAALAPSGEALVREYVAAFNAGEPAIRAFFEAYATSEVPVDQRLERYRALKGDAGRLTVRRIVSASADGVEAELQTEDGPARFSFMLTGGKLAGIRVEVGGPEEAGEGAPALPSRDQPTALGDIRQIVQRASIADEFSGVVLVTRSGTSVFETAVGDATKDTHTPNTLETRFNVGSIGKSFTATAIAQLLAAGKLSLDDTVGKFLPEYPNATVREKVTVRHLLDMRSGIGDFFGPRYEQADRTRLRTLADYLPLFASEPLHFEPGERREYSNGGFVVLGLIIEKVSGRPYDEYLQAHVFGPAGMHSTGFFPKSTPIPNRALGYTTRLGGPRRNNFETLPERGSSAGGVYSTAGDLVRYVEALAAGRLVALDTLAMVGRDPKTLGIAGGAPGLNAALESGVNGYTFAVLSNYDPPSAERVARAIRRVLESVR